MCPAIASATGFVYSDCANRIRKVSVSGMESSIPTKPQSMPQKINAIRMVIGCAIALQARLERGQAGEPPAPEQINEARSAAAELARYVPGTVLGAVFAAANVYVGMKAGLTVSASIPVAVMAVAAFRGMRRMI